MAPIGTGLATALLATLAIGVPAANADDLLVLNGDSVTLSGNVQYGIVYIDGDLRLAGDTSITAGSIYFGPNSYLDTCFVAGTGDSGCTSGRNLTMHSSGPLTVARGVDLTAGTGTVQQGGNLSLTGSPVSIGGDITTAGSGGGRSGQVTITSGDALSTGAIDAPGAAVGLTAQGTIDVGDDIDTEGTSQVAVTDPARVQSAGPVTISSSGGDVRIDGDIGAYGRDAPAAGGLGGGNGAPVTITGSDVRTGAINATGGSAQAGPGGASAPITVTARGALSALGQLDASGQNDAVAGTGGAQIQLSGATVTANRVSVGGGDAPGSAPYGPAGPGGTIAITGASGVSLGALDAGGGNAYYGGTSGNGGSISVGSSSGSIATGSVQTDGGYAGAGPGTNGGPIVLSAAGNLSVGGTLDAGGSDAGGSFDPPRGGGDAGSVLLRAAIGTLTLSGNAGAVGGRGSDDPVGGQLGGSGGRGGRVDVVAHALGPIVSLSSGGGDGGAYGDDQGPGGAGGAIYAWTDGPLFDDQKLVSSDGGDGNPTGATGAKRQDSSPATPTVSPSTGALSFTSRSPDAQGYLVLSSAAGATPQTVLRSDASSGLVPRVPVCTPVKLTVEAVNPTVGWTSDPSAAVEYRRPPSAHQNCSQAPRITAAKATKRSLRKLRRAKWIAAIPVNASGVGQLTATLTRAARAGKASRGRPLVSVSEKLLSAGRHTVRVTVPGRARHAGLLVVRLVTTSPDGKGHAAATTTLEIVK